MPEFSVQKVQKHERGGGGEKQNKTKKQTKQKPKTTTKKRKTKTKKNPKNIFMYPNWAPTHIVANPELLMPISVGK